MDSASSSSCPTNGAPPLASELCLVTPARVTPLFAALTSSSASQAAGIRQSGCRSPSMRTIAPGSASSTEREADRHSDQSRKTFRSTGDSGPTGRAHLGQGTFGLRPAAAPSKEVSRELLLFLEGAAAPLPASSRRPGNDHLKTAGVGHQGLTPVDGPAVRRGRQPFQGFRLDRGEKVQVAPVRVGQLGGAAHEQLGQPLRDFGDSWHGQSIPRRRGYDRPGTTTRLPPSSGRKGWSAAPAGAQVSSPVAQGRMGSCQGLYGVVRSASGWSTCRSSWLPPPR